MQPVLLPSELFENEVLGLSRSTATLKWRPRNNTPLMYEIFEWLDEEKTTWQLKSET